jgi:hypothetical protein
MENKILIYIIMIIYKFNNETYAFIHIPKNSGTYIRDTIMKDSKYNVLQSFWGISRRIDTAHIPYILKNKFIEIY